MFSFRINNSPSKIKNIVSRYPTAGKCFTAEITLEFPRKNLSNPFWNCRPLFRSVNRFQLEFWLCSWENFRHGRSKNQITGSQNSTNNNQYIQYSQKWSFKTSWKYFSILIIGRKYQDTSAGSNDCWVSRFLNNRSREARFLFFLYAAFKRIQSQQNKTLFRIGSEQICPS